jgi:uncharacterized sporulation protein YeaH/YhbH (DUF444 family)
LLRGRSSDERTISRDGSKESLHIARSDLEKLQADQIAVVEMSRAHVADTGAEGCQMAVRFEHDIELGFRLKRRRRLDQGPRGAEVQDLHATLRGQRARQPADNLESSLRATIGHGVRFV